MSARTRIILAVGVAALIAVLLAVAVPAGTAAKVAVLLAAAIAIVPSSDRQCRAGFVTDDDGGTLTLTCARTGLHTTHHTDDGTQFRRYPGRVVVTEPDQP